MMGLIPDPAPSQGRVIGGGQSPPHPPTENEILPVGRIRDGSGVRHAFLLFACRPEPIIICAAFLFIRNAAFFYISRCRQDSDRDI